VHHRGTENAEKTKKSISFVTNIYTRRAQSWRKLFRLLRVSCKEGIKRDRMRADRAFFKKTRREYLVEKTENT